ncbi:hypothetical protein [Methanobrevibacter filiformis]|uniref:Apea-like HEPN domain-containing protein n=1 Tax=Methanobrevibacter filiformis TaxID=55758 RepID=A0A166EBD4_9EURY|nr:hypothetical protein [Methanobrevibacter filiformis]KZX16472.1 hypothetical protein MBFIL_05140 [Methanobrevibacter filiformis]
MTNYNPLSIQITKSWFLKAESEKDPINKFICLWASFNCFFSAELFDKTFNRLRRQYMEFGGDLPNYSPDNVTEHQLLKTFRSTKSYKQIYMDLLSSSNEFKDDLDSFVVSLKNKEFNNYSGHIVDMRSGKLGANYSARFTDADNFNQFIGVIYQIRCNLYHGNKNMSYENDIEIVKNINDSFLHYLYNLYSNEGYLG